MQETQKIRSPWLMGAAVVPLVLASSAAYAQPSSSSDKSSTLGEVVVTARSRTERLQDVPITVDVVSNQTIKDTGAKSLIDLSALAPSFVYAATQRGQATINMRGLNPNTYGTNRQGVSFFIDGVYVPGEVTSLNFQDVDHIEVLEGPQATHFGRGTYAGAVNLITRVPTLDHVTGHFDGEVSSYSSHDVNLTVNAPLVQDKLFASVSVRHYERGSLYPNRNTGAGTGQQTSQNYAANLLWLPRSGTSVKMRASYDFDADGDPAAYTLYRQDMAQYDHTFPSGKTYPVFTLRSIQPQLIGYVDGPFDPSTGRNRVRIITDMVATQDLGGVAQLQYSFGYFHEFNRLVSDIGNRWLADPTLIGAHPAYNPSQNLTQSFDNDIRAFSTGEGRLKWTAGAHYYDSYYEGRDEYGKVTLGTTTINPLYPASQTGKYDTVNGSAYGSLGYEFLPRLTLTGEGRYQVERVGYEGCTFGGVANPAAGNCQAYVARLMRTDSNFLPRVTLDYKPTSFATVYALYSVGLKSAAISASSSQASLAAALTYEQANSVPPERANNYEVGWKTQWFDRRLTLNGAAFHMNVTNQQVTTFYVANNVYVGATSNAGASTINGVELTTRAVITPAWTFDGGFAYIHHEYTSAGASTSTLTNLFGGGTPQASLQGRTTIKTPHWTANASSEYRFDLPRHWGGAVRVDVQYVGDRFADTANFITLPAYERTELSARFNHGSTTITGFIKNLFDERDPIDAAEGYGDLTETGARAGATPSIIVYLPYGRQFGLRLNQAF